MQDLLRLSQAKTLMSVQIDVMNYLVKSNCKLEDMQEINHIFKQYLNEI